MADLQTELSGLLTLQADMQAVNKLKEKINQQKNKIAASETQIKKKFVLTEPGVDRTESQRMEKKMQEFTKSQDYTMAGLFTVCDLAIAIIGFCTGSGGAKLLAVLAAAVFWLFGCFGLVPVMIGAGLATLIGWNVWSHTSLLWQIILGVLAVACVIFSHRSNLEDKEEKVILEKMKADIENQKKAEDADLEQRRANFKEKQKNADKEYQETCDKMNKELLDELDRLYEELDEILNRISDNPVLDNSDKTPEVLEFVISQIQRKRANSLADALLQYDGMVRQRDKDRLERETRQLQWEMDRMWRDQQIRQEADDRFNQAMHNMRVEKEQRRQTELLQELKDSLDN